MSTYSIIYAFSRMIEYQIVKDDISPSFPVNGRRSE